MVTRFQSVDEGLQEQTPLTPPLTPPTRPGRLASIHITPAFAGTEDSDGLQRFLPRNPARSVRTANRRARRLLRADSSGRHQRHTAEAPAPIRTARHCDWHGESPF